MTKLISNILCPPRSFMSFLPFEVVRMLPNMAFEEDGCVFWGRRMVIGLGFRSVSGVGVEKKKSGQKKQTYILLCTDYCVTLPHSIYKSS